ncbi:MAG: tandem-95 repeat protein [Planctomycetes bacterium]|nr:tandem-95 repeat protein [Planctomycetota bacterium]
MLSCRQPATGSLYTRARSFAALLSIGLGFAAMTCWMGGCPSESSVLPDSSGSSGGGSSTTPGTVVAGATDDRGSGGDGGGGDGGGGGGGSSPSGPSGDQLVGTIQGRPVDIVLRAQSLDGPETSFAITSSSLQGTLGEIRALTGRTAVVSYQPAADFVGAAQLSYQAEDEDAFTLVDVVVYPEIVFSYSPSQGQSPLTVEFEAIATGGHSLPDGTYTWLFNDLAEAGTLATHGSRSRLFTGGRHTIGLIVLFAGMIEPDVCMATDGRSDSNGTAHLSVNPKITGSLRDANGTPLPNIVVVASGQATSSMSDDQGRFQVLVPLGWSGTITPSPLGHRFEPSNRSYLSVANDLADQNFVDQNVPPPANQQPTAYAQSVQTDEDNALVITLTGSDPEGAGLHYVVQSLPSSATLRDESNSQTIASNSLPYTIAGDRVRFTPSANFNGVASFQFAVNDGSGASNALSASATVSITVRPVNDPPTAPAQSETVQPSTPASIHLSASDVDNDSLTYSITTGVQHGALTGSGAHRTYTPTGGYEGPDSFVYRATDPSGAWAEAIVSIAVTPWTPPIGVPTPGFGLTQSHTMYAGQTYNFSSGAAPYPDAGNGPYTHYVDNTHPQATDSGNPYGTASQPRVSVPGNLPAGSVVEIHGGPYSYGSGYIEMNGHGSSSQPIFIRGVGSPRFNQKISVYGAGNYESYYMIFDGLDLYKWEVIGPANHVALRHSEVRNGGGIGMGGTSSYPISDMLVYDTVVHDNGDWQASFDEDRHGVAVGGYSSNIWIMDCEFYHNSGDGVQINAGGGAAQASTHHIYVARNLAWENKQTGFWTKQAVDVVFSQNTARDHQPIGASPSAWGAGMGYQYGPERVWFLYNHIYNCCFGIQANSTSGLGSGTETFFVGNVIHDIRHNANYGYNADTAWSNAGMTLVGTPNKYIVNNTIYNCDAGVNIPGTVGLFMENNIIAQMVEPQGNHLFVEDTSGITSKVIEHNLYYQSGGSAARRPEPRRRASKATRSS